jgi:hypothetical protein
LAEDTFSVGKGEKKEEDDEKDKETERRRRCGIPQYLYAGSITTPTHTKNVNKENYAVNVSILLFLNK